MVLGLFDVNNTIAISQKWNNIRKTLLHSDQSASNCIVYRNQSSVTCGKGSTQFIRM